MTKNVEVDKKEEQEGQAKKVKKPVKEKMIKIKDDAFDHTRVSRIRL